METDRLTLTHWDIRGFTEPVIMLMEYLHVPYTETKLDGAPPVPDWSSSLGLDFPSLPTLQDQEHHVSLTQAIAICRYLAQKYRPKMVGAAMNECAEIDSILSLAHDIRNVVLGAKLAGWTDNGEKAMVFVKEKLGYINKYMRSRTWLSGKQVSIADFIFCELLEFLLHIDGTLMEICPNCHKLMRRFHAIPEIAKHKAVQPDFDLEKYLKLPFMMEH